MQTARPTDARPSRRNVKPQRARLGRTWQDRTWRVRLLGPLAARDAASPSTTPWRRNGTRPADPASPAQGALPG